MTALIVALDFAALSVAKRLSEDLTEHVDGFKVGLELLMGEGPTAITSIAESGKPVFADAKLHDIPNTVAAAARRISNAGARWVTVHASGGEAMLRAGVEGMGGDGVLAVTVLTSLGPEDLPRLGIDATPDQQVHRLARLAESCGVEGLVSAPGEVAALRAAGTELDLFTPGIRLEGQDAHDQKRVATPQAAAEAGADFLVVGRAITGAVDPVAAAREIASSLVTAAETADS